MTMIEPASANGFYYRVSLFPQNRASQDAHNSAFDALFTLKPPTEAEYRRARQHASRRARRMAIAQLDGRRERRRFFAHRPA